MKIKQKIQCLAVLLAGTAMLGGCSKEPGSPGGNKVAVSFTAPYIDQAEAASTQGTAPGTREALKANTTVRVVAYAHATTGNPSTSSYAGEQTYYITGGKLAPCTVNADGTFKAADAGSSLKVTPGAYDFYAITPALPLTGNTTVTVPYDKDYATSITSNVAISANQTLTLTQLARKCAKVTLVVQKDASYTEMTALALTSGGTGVSLSPMPATKSVTIGSDIPSTAGTDTYPIGATGFALSGTTSTRAVVLLPRPSANLTLSYDLTYTISGTTTTRSISGTVPNLAFEAGKSYTLTLTIKKTESSITATAWEDGGSQTISIGGATGVYPYKVLKADGGYIYVSRDLYGSSARSFHDKWTTTPIHNELSPLNAVSSAFEAKLAGTNCAWTSGAAECAKLGTGWRFCTKEEFHLYKRTLPTRADGPGIWIGTESSANAAYAWFENGDGSASPRIDTRSKSTTYHTPLCVRDL